MGALHEQHATEYSLLEADGLADFAASQSQREGASIRDEQGSVYSPGLWSGGSSTRRREEEDLPHSSPARYNPRDLPTSFRPDHRSSLVPSSHETPPAEYPRYDTWRSVPVPVLVPPPSLSAPLVHAWSEPTPSLSRPPLRREALSQHPWDDTRSSRRNSPSAYPQYSPVAYASPPPFPSSSSSSRARPSWPLPVDSFPDPYPFDDVDDAAELRGDLGAQYSFARPPLAMSMHDGAGFDPSSEGAGREEAGEWTLPGGAYQHGVGFDSRAPKRSTAAAIERRRERLARKFGGGAVGAPGREVRRTVEDVTGVDESGRLVTVGRKKRVGFRCAQVGCAVLVGVGAIGAAFTHPVSP